MSLEHSEIRLVELARLMCMRDEREIFPAAYEWWPAAERKEVTTIT